MSFSNLFSGKDIEKEYYDSGELMLEYEVDKESKKSGFYKHFYKNGLIRQTTFFKNDLQEGTNKIYNEEGIKLRESIMSAGKYIDSIKEYYKNGELRSIFKINSGRPIKEDDNLIYFYPNGKKSFSISFQAFYITEIPKKFKENSSLENLVWYKSGIHYSPQGIWEIYDENETVTYKVNFNSLYPKKSQKTEFEVNFFELQKFNTDGLLIQKDFHRIISINFEYFSNLSKDIFDRPDKDNLTPPNLLQDIIISVPFEMFDTLKPLEKKYSEQFNIEKVEDKVDWAYPFRNLYKPQDNHYNSPLLPFFDKGKLTTLKHPTTRISINYYQSTIQFVTLSELDANILINEIMIAFGGVHTFSIDEFADEKEDDIEGFEWKNIDLRSNPVFTLHKMKSNRVNYYKKEGNNTIECNSLDECNFFIEQFYVVMKILPYKNIVNRPIYFETERRGIHPDSLHINNLFLHLNKPIFCLLEGGVLDGRFSVSLDNDNPKIIIGMYESKIFDNAIEDFKNMTFGFSLENEILKLKNQDIINILDKNNNNSYASKNRGRNSIMVSENIFKDDGKLCFEVDKKILVSLFKENSIIILRIDNQTDDSWENLSINNSMIEVFNI